MEKIFSPESLICFQSAASWSLPSCSCLVYAYQFRSLLHVCPLQPRNNRRPQVHRLYHADQALRNGITSYNTAEDVDKDSCDFWIAGNEVECLLDSLRRGTSTNIKEIGWLTAVQLDNVHCCHCQAGAVDQAADVAVEFDEVETRSERVRSVTASLFILGARILSRLDFIRVLLCPVAP